MILHTRIGSKPDTSLYGGFFWGNNDSRPGLTFFLHVAGGVYHPKEHDGPDVRSRLQQRLQSEYQEIVRATVHIRGQYSGPVLNFWAQQINEDLQKDPDSPMDSTILKVLQRYGRVEAQIGSIIIPSARRYDLSHIDFAKLFPAPF